MNMRAALSANRDLLDPKFQSYKLSLKKGIIITTLENEGIDLKSPKNNFSKLSVYLSSLHNCLFQDRFNPNHMYYRSGSDKIKALVVSHRKEAFSSGETVFVLPEDAISDKYNTSLICLRDHVLLSSGSNYLYLLHTGDRSSEVLSSWKLVFELEIDLASKAGYLIDAVSSSGPNMELQIDCILISVHQSGDEKAKVHLDWLTLSKNSDSWSLNRHRRLLCNSFPDHVSFDGNADSLTVRSPSPLIPFFDTANPNIKPPVVKAPNSEAVEENSHHIRFTWTQSLPTMPEGDSTLLNILIKLTDKHKDVDPKHDFHVECKPSEGTPEEIKLSCLNISMEREGQTIQLCSARLFAPVKFEDVMWTFDRETNSIDITLVKEDPGTWPRLLADVDEERRLGVKYDEESLPAVMMDDPEEPMQSCFNVEQLEDVDMVLDDDEGDAVLQRIDGTTLQPVVKVEMTGHRKLYTALTRFNVDAPNTSIHLLCTRYDVDGLLWAPGLSSSVLWTHVATLQAFGYVLASKQNRRFVASPPIDLSTTPCTPQFVAVADITRHIYVYWQPAKNPLTELRHRKPDRDSNQGGSSGSREVHVAWQQVIALPENDEIIGFAAVAGEPYAACVVATRRALYLVCLNEGED